MLPKVKPLTMLHAKILAIVSSALLLLVIASFGFVVPNLLGWVDLENASLIGLTLDFSKLDAIVISMFLCILLRVTYYTQCYMQRLVLLCQKLRMYNLFRSQLQC